MTSRDMIIIDDIAEDTPEYRQKIKEAYEQHLIRLEGSGFTWNEMPIAQSAKYKEGKRIGETQATRSLLPL